MIASSLFHFTKDATTLSIILRDWRFRSAYCIEDVSEFGFDVRYLGIPMVCFCDIPLKFIRPHSKRYGAFGIGLRKQWAIRNKINPLHYLVKASPISQSIKEIKELLKDRNLSSAASIEDIQRQMAPIVSVQDRIVRLAAFTKPYKKYKVDFYQEREWRYIPEVLSLAFETDNSIITRNRLNTDYDSSGRDYIYFSIDDINHIVVPSAHEIDNIMDMIDSFALDRLDKLRLIQRITDLKSVEKDF
jgi:hypothetical protein